MCAKSNRKEWKEGRACLLLGADEITIIGTGEGISEDWLIAATSVGVGVGTLFQFEDAPLQSHQHELQEVHYKVRGKQG